MLNVLYSCCKNSQNGMVIDELQIQEEYLHSCMYRHKSFRLTDDEESFVINLILLIARYMEHVLIEEEYNSITMAKLLYMCVIDQNGKSQFVRAVECSIDNKDFSLTARQTGEIKKLLKTIEPFYNSQNIMLVLQIVQHDCMLNHECSQAVSNLLNLAAVKCLTKDTSDLCMLDELFDDLGSDQYLHSVFPEFSAHYESLIKQYDSQVSQTNNELLDYIYEKYAKLPNLLKEKLKQYDFQIYITNELFGKSSELRKLGTTHINGKIIRVWMENNPVVVDMSFEHEMGHVADCVFGSDGLNSKTDKAWAMIFEIDKNRYYETKMEEGPELVLLHDYAVTNATEYFAFAFADYVQNPEWLRMTVPDTFYYMDALLSGEE